MWRSMSIDPAATNKSMHGKHCTDYKVSSMLCWIIKKGGHDGFAYLSSLATNSVYFFISADLVLKLMMHSGAH